MQMCCFLMKSLETNKLFSTGPHQNSAKKDNSGSASIYYNTDSYSHYRKLPDLTIKFNSFGDLNKSMHLFI